MADVVVAGAAGRMGNRLVALLQEDKELRLVAALEAPGHPALGRDAGEVAGVGRLTVPITADAEAVLGKDRILIEFSVPEASLAHARLAARQGGRAVIGTTGFTPAQREELAAIGRSTAILVAPNMSVGVNVAFRILARHGADAGRRLRRGDRRDPPSLQEGRSQRHRAAHGRGGGRGARARSRQDRGLRSARQAGRAVPRKEIGIAALRSGDVVGEHTVSFGALGERLELTHRAQSRDNFARGALRAARFIATARPGLYSMQDVLGLA